MFWQFLVNSKTIYAPYEMSLELGHYRWCHTGYCYTHHSQAMLACMAPSVSSTVIKFLLQCHYPAIIKNKGTPNGKECENFQLPK